MEKRKQNSHKAVLIVALFCWSCAGRTVEKPAPAQVPEVVSAPSGDRVTLDTPSVIEGGVFFVHIDTAGDAPKSVEGSFLDKPLGFYKDGANRYTALGGVEWGTKIEPKDLVAKVCRASCAEIHAKVTLIKGVFPSEVLKVPPRTVQPKPEDKIRIAKDNEKLNAAYATGVSEKLWSGPVRMPVDGIVTSQYGNSRVYNGVHTSPHLGTDFRAAVGTPVHAALTGRVILATDLFLTGNTVVLDHGYGFFTIYCHMSKLEVKVGDKVVREALLGLSGMTGRASGPHLHWGVKLNKMRIDAMRVVDLLGKEK